MYGKVSYDDITRLIAILNTTDKVDSKMIRLFKDLDM